MGLIKCPEHGLRFVILCCQQIADAVDEGRYEHANVMIDMCGQAAALGDQRRDDVRRWNASTPRWGWPDQPFDPPLAVRCELHVDAWLARTGQGTLSEALDNASGGPSR